MTVFVECLDVVDNDADDVCEAWKGLENADGYICMYKSSRALRAGSQRDVAVGFGTPRLRDGTRHCRDTECHALDIPHSLVEVRQRKIFIIDTL